MIIIPNKQLLLQVTILNSNNLLLCGNKYSYRIWMIFKQIYYFIIPLGQSRLERKNDEGILHAPQLFIGL